MIYNYTKYDDAFRPDGSKKRKENHKRKNKKTKNTT